jgi:molecular chaperone HscC
MSIDVPPAPAGEVSLDVRFTYTLDGLLEVECQCQGNPAISRRIIEKVPGQMSDEQIAESLQKLAALKIHPRDRKENVALLARCSRLYERLLGTSEPALTGLQQNLSGLLRVRSRSGLNVLHERLNFFSIATKGSGR